MIVFRINTLKLSTTDQVWLCNVSAGIAYTSLGFRASTLMLRSPAGQKHLLVLLIVCARAPVWYKVGVSESVRQISGDGSATQLVRSLNYRCSVQS